MNGGEETGVELGERISVADLESPLRQYLRHASRHSGAGATGWNLNWLRVLSKGSRGLVVPLVAKMI